MAPIKFPTDTVAVTPVPADILLLADASDSNRPKSATVTQIVQAGLEGGIDTNVLVVDATNDRIGYLTTAPTRTNSFGSTSTGIGLHNVADQTTNFEEGGTFWSGNVFHIFTVRGGSGTVRPMYLSSNTASASGSSGNYARLQVLQGTTAPNFNFVLSSTGNVTSIIGSSPTLTASSVVTSLLSLTPTINMTSTGGYNDIFINNTISATGSGIRNLILAQEGSTTKFQVDNNGGLLNARVIVASGTTTPVTVTAAESNKVYTNEGATAKIVYNLPTAVAGYTYTFIVQDADGIDVTAAAGDTIRRNTNVTAAAGTVTSTAIGSVLVLVAINATERLAVNEIGTRA